jgi:hypothetical protein
MRDIRSDLEERANLIQGQVQAAYAHFEKLTQQIQAERDAKIAELSETLAMINKLMQFESGMGDKVVTLSHAPGAKPPAANPSLIDRLRSASA